VADTIAELVESIRRVFPGSQFEPATAEQLATERRDHPDAPAHYLEFLQRVGWGSLGDNNFMVYSGLVGPDDIFDPLRAAELSGLLFFGDNFAGWLVGFDTLAEWRLVGVDDGLEPQPLEQHTVAEFIARFIADFEDARPGAAADGGA
jgi:hypothetical protein